MGDESERRRSEDLFHSYLDIVNAPAPKFAIDRFHQEDGVTCLGALAGHSKTLGDVGHGTRDVRWREIVLLL